MPTGPSKRPPDTKSPFLRSEPLRRRLIVLAASIAALVAFAIYVDLPGTPGFGITVAGRDLSQLEFRQGLDLQGGLHVAFQANPVDGQVVDEDAMEAVRQILENRVNALGVAEPQVQLEGSDRVIVELPGIEDPDEAIALFKQTGRLDVIGTQLQSLPVGSSVDVESGAYELVISGPDLLDADLVYDEIGNGIVQFELNDAGAEKFGAYTGTHIGQFLSILVDGIVINSAVINDRIENRGVIEGFDNLQEARNVVIQLRYGALPVPLEVIRNITVGPTLGAESLDKSVRAGLVGFVMVAIFMIAYYRLPGVVAALALAIYALLVFAIFKLIPVTLTLAGIAGFILSIGMAVDANILIFERTREELRNGVSLNRSIHIGFRRAWTSIRDSNIATLITCTVLWYFGTGLVKGFALTLGIGVLVSMFSAISVSRTILLLLVRARAWNPADLFGVETPDRGGA